MTYGIVGGGEGAFIGVVHRSAIALSGCATLVCGCFSRDLQKNQATGRKLSLEPERVYETFTEMAEREAARPDRPEFMVVATRNEFHFRVCSAFLKAGFHVMCEKPLATSVPEALELQRLAEERHLLLGVSYTYSGHVMALEARELIRAGEIGEILMVMGEYPQDWLLEMAEGANHGISTWRIDPEISGSSNCVGDIGTHIEHSVSFMTGLKISKLCAVMDRFGAGTELDNNAAILIKYENGATGNYWCSQVAAGYDNALKLRIFGTSGSIEFDQEASNYLTVTKKGGAPQRYSRGRGYVSGAAAAYSLIPPGHPEGYHNAFANLYRSYCEAVRDALAGVLRPLETYDFPTVQDGVSGVRFIEKCLESANRDSVWVAW